MIYCCGSIDIDVYTNMKYGLFIMYCCSKIELHILDTFKKQKSIDTIQIIENQAIRMIFVFLNFFKYQTL